MSERPVVLVVGGLDPSGGAGLAADIQAVTAIGAHPAPVATLVTAQNTQGLRRSDPLPPEWVEAQAEAVLADMVVAAIKLGTMGSAAVARAVAGLIARHPDVPVVLDPVMAASRGGSLAKSGLVGVYREALLPLSVLATPNRNELEALAPSDGAAELLALGLPACLVTGGEGSGARIVHELHTEAGIELLPGGQRLAGDFHGTGCTLASAIAARIALGDTLIDAILAGDAFVQHALKHAFAPGRGQAIPGRW